jgi:hypothetical protein
VSAPDPRRGRLQLAGIAIVFLGPLIVAFYMYRTGLMTPAGMSNNGVLFDPVVSLSEKLPGSALHAVSEGHWVMLYANSGACDDECRDALYRLRQTRLMVGREMDRIVRVFLHGDSPPDRVFLEGEYPGLKTINDKGLGNLLEENRPENAMPGGIYLFDPLANLVMYFPPDLEPRDLVDDVRHLLRLSQIG